MCAGEVFFLGGGGGGGGGELFSLNYAFTYALTVPFSFIVHHIVVFQAAVGI